MIKESCCIWYLLFRGQSEDGKGQPHYYTRTTNYNEVLDFYNAYIKHNPYSISKIMVVTDTKYQTLYIEDNL